MSSKLVNEARSMTRIRSGCTPSPEEVQDTVQVALKRLSALGYRRTPLLHTVLSEMATSHAPVTVSDLMSMPGIGECDHSSAYRLLKRLESEGIVTRLGVAHKAPHYMLVMPGHQHTYLVCTMCGVLEEADCPPPAKGVCVDCEFTPWTNVKPELWFTGICPDCT